MFKPCVIRKYCGENPRFHANDITVVSGLISVVSIIAHSLPYVEFITPITGLKGTLGDLLDGDWARAYNQRTLEGAILDPLVDKFRHLSASLFLYAPHVVTSPSATSFFLLGSAGANLVVDYISQKDRGPIIEQLKSSYRAWKNPETCTKIDENNINENLGVEAVDYGKYKTLLQSISFLTYMGSKPYSKIFIENPQIHEGFEMGTEFIVASLLVGSAYLGAKGIQEKRKLKAQASSI